MKKYFFFRVLRSLFSIAIVITIAIGMVYYLVPRDRVFKNDPIYQKLISKPFEFVSYKYGTLEDLGYIDFMMQSDICEKYYPENFSTCTSQDSVQIQEWISQNDKNWNVETIRDVNLIYAYKDVNFLTRVVRWYGALFVVDHVNRIDDPDNTNMIRRVYIENDYKGFPALKCDGCEHKYLVYFDSSFPFVHQNILKINMGISFPAYAGISATDVISDTQGKYKFEKITFETGVTQQSPLNIFSCKYKNSSLIDRIDESLFVDNYADCKYNLDSPSMMSISMLIGLFALLVSYLIGIPFGVFMAQKKNKAFDKFGMVFVTVMISVPSLAFIYTVRVINRFFGLTDTFQFQGSNAVVSYLSPIIVLGLLGISGLIIWIRRYMLDQTTSDYVKFARAKGLSQSEIFFKHILRNAILPIAQGIPAAILATIGGAVMTESVFGIPGMGKMLPDSILGNNNTMIIALTFIFTAISIFSLLFGDILMTYLDPRISLAKKGGRK